MSKYDNKVGKLQAEELKLVERLNTEWLTNDQEAEIKKRLERVRSWITIYKRMISEGK